MLNIIFSKRKKIQSKLNFLGGNAGKKNSKKFEKPGKIQLV